MRRGHGGDRGEHLALAEDRGVDRRDPRGGAPRLPRRLQPRQPFRAASSTPRQGVGASNFPEFSIVRGNCLQILNLPNSVE